MNVDEQEVAALERHVGAQATSPLFAKLASLYLESGRAQDALRICDAGLANYPFYSTAHLIKGKVLLHLGMNGEARREFEFVRNWLPTNAAVTQMLESVPISDEQVLEAPPAEEGPALAETPVVDDVAGATPYITPGESTPEETTEDTSNVFGLPSEAPAEVLESAAEDDGSSASDFGETGAFAQFGDSETPTMEVPAGGEIEPTAPEDVFSGSPAGESTSVPAGLEGSFEAYAIRKRSELGPTDQTTLEEYLASPAPSGEPESSAGAAPEGENAFSAAGFGPAEEEASPTALSDEQSAGEDSGSFGEQASEQPESTESPFGSEEMSGLEAFGGGSEIDSEQPQVVESDTSSFDLSGMQAFSGGGAETPTDETSQSDGFGLDADAASPEAESESPTAATPESMDGFGSEAEETAPTRPIFAEEDKPPSADDFTPEEPPASESSAEDVFAGFVGPGEKGDEATPEPEETQADDEGAHSFPDFNGLATAEDGEQEETVASEEPEPDSGGFSGPPMEPPGPPAAQRDKIGEFAEKLQDAKKITPVIDLSSQMASYSPSSADEAAADAGFVTPTLAEIYAKQGWYDDAINAYRTLAKSRPAEKEKFEKRVKELEEEKAKAD